MEKPLQAYNVDGTKNKQGTIKYYVNLNLEINGRKDNYRIIGNWTGERKNHPRIPLVARTKPRYQLEDKRILLERT